MLKQFSQNSVEQRGPRKTPLDFGGSPDHVTLGLWLRGQVIPSVTVTICSVRIIVTWQ